MGDTTDWLIQAAQLAGAGEFEKAIAEADRVADLAVTNALVTMQHIDVMAEGPLPEFSALIRETLAPLRQLLYGVSLLRECTAQTMDLIMSFGERISAQVLAHLLAARGFPAQFLDAREWTVTDGTFGEAVVDFHASRLALDAHIALMDESVIPVTTGFLGKTTDGRTTTLGRNGSDYTATLLARCLNAQEVCIWTDVSGVMTGDPRLVRDAYPLERLSYMEAVELAYFGTRMFHPRTMIPLIESGIPMRIRNTMRPEDPGTTIDASGALDFNSPTSVTSLENMALIGVEWRKLSQRATVGERVLRALDSADVPVWMASQSAHGQAVAIVIPEDEVKRAEAVINDELALELERREANPLVIHHGVTLLTLVCETMGQQPNVAGRFFAALGNTGVMIHAIAQGSSSRSISCVIDTENTATAVRTVHSVFNFAHEVVSLLVMGKGVVGSELLSQLAAQRIVLKEQHGIELQVVGLCSSRKIVYREDGIALSEWQAALESQGSENTPQALRQCVQEFSRLPVPILVDCTAAEGMESVYRHAFEHGVHVAAANKKPLTIPYQSLETLRETVKHNHRTWNYETTVGASLPVIDTLINLVRTGDTVQLIEGSFSGTLGYLTNEVMSGVPLSQAVRCAKALGYTEPRPQEDLSGMDVARKALILARELGLPLELGDVALTPLVPAELLSDDMTVDQFFERLGDYDEEFSDRIKTMKDAGHSLRYLARIDPFPSEGQPILTVGPVELEAGHPATQLRGSEAFVAFNTARYQDYPLIVRGSGAGGAVTAAGVLADILRTAQAARGK
ncbi:MAG: bifunctional aspartate kinase/homoserine dehydrogenase I, partial [Myxococcota bacterium]|nr:bifunctional aspartate kinase/homoserine dehydrogenase I [Myxococcota bacterium]